MLHTAANTATRIDLSPLRDAIEASGDIVYDWDLASDCLTLFGKTDTLFGPAEEHLEISGEAFGALVSPEDMAERKRRLSHHMSGQGAYDCEYRLRGSDGEFHWVHDRGAASLSPSGVPERFVGILRLVTQRKQREARLEYQANFDELTGHFNKMRLREALEQSLAQSLRYRQTGAFIVIGVDQMGMINTAYGYEAGDKILISTSASGSTSCLRASDVVGRLGGDRFGILMTQLLQRGAGAARTLGTGPAASCASRRSTSQDKPGRTSPSRPAIVSCSRAQSKTLVRRDHQDRKRPAAGPRPPAATASSVYRADRRTAPDVYQTIPWMSAKQVKLALKEDRLIFAYQPVVDAKTQR